MYRDMLDGCDRATEKHPHLLWVIEAGTPPREVSSEAPTYEAGQDVDAGRLAGPDEHLASLDVLQVPHRCQCIGCQCNQPVAVFAQQVACNVASLVTTLLTDQSRLRGSRDTFSIASAENRVAFIANQMSSEGSSVLSSVSSQCVLAERLK